MPLRMPTKMADFAAWRSPTSWLFGDPGLRKLSAMARENLKWLEQWVSQEDVN